MKNTIKISGVILLVILIHSCKKDRHNPPTVTTTEITSITQTTAESGGNISDDGGATVTIRGVCWNTSEDPTTADNKTKNGTGTGVFTSSINALSPGTTYYLRSYATSSIGTGYGQEIQFTSLFEYTGQTGSINDIDGNTYLTIGIGSQIWMKENLKTTKYNDGTAIPLVTDEAAWAALTTPGYCWFNNDTVTNKVTYGALYNWYTVNMGKLCATGWHVPTDAEWTTLTDYLTNNGYGFRGSGSDIAKSMAATSGWVFCPGAGLLGDYPGGTNSSGFTALPGSKRENDGTFPSLFGSSGIGYVGYWWSATEHDATDGQSLSLYNEAGYAVRFHFNKKDGFSVRCIKDN